MVPKKGRHCEMARGAGGYHPVCLLWGLGILALPPQADESTIACPELDMERGAREVRNRRHRSWNYLASCNVRLGHLGYHRL